ncbi:MAG: hypothetical protein ACTSRI_00270 [Promethearchaeota archaeon]
MERTWSSYCIPHIEGAIINDRGDPNKKEFKIRTNWSSKEKEIIAQYAVKNYINDNNMIYLDAQKSVEGYHIVTAFILGTSFTIGQGIMDPHPLEMEIKKKMCKKANKIIVLIDSSKFNKTSLSTFLSVDQIDVLITDDKSPKDMIKKIRSKNVNVDIITLT